MSGSKLPDLWKTYLTQCQLGELLSSQGEIEEAETLLLKGCRSLKQCREKIPLTKREQHLSCLKTLVELYESRGDTEQSDHWRAELDSLSKE
ncbi:hypothetical protein NG895_24145 [Aeoliella sp. ICT_H6.2]|uniref:Tetratricopeptide repeat protein n=1 Tax=Aeoliella straminimaris TaxID=2954799 RepID=A0A9X2FFC2_9BACT|nr:hypothetical protein [Aeoliella straminimaris]MCO6047002.1 hypothetical protein [Aeoliella straminimaris]